MSFLINPYAFGGAGVSVTTFSPYYRNDGLAMSNGNKTVTHNGVTGARAIMTRDAKLAGKYYIEITVDAVGSEFSIGIVDYVQPLDNFIGSSSNNASVAYINDGRTIQNGAGAIFGNPTFTTGDIIGVKFDCDGRTVAFNKNGGAYTTARAISGTQPLMLCVNMYHSGAFTANFGATAYAYSPPSGFGVWTPNAAVGRRYWIYWQRAAPRSYFHLRELEFREAVGGADNTSGKTPYVGGTSGGAAANLIDDNLGTAWEHAVLQTHAGVDYGAGQAKINVEGKLVARDDFTDYPRNFMVLASDDGATWWPWAGFTDNYMTRGERKVFTWADGFSLPAQSTVLWNPADKSAKYTLADGNHAAFKITTDAEDSMLRATKSIAASAKGYFECIVAGSSTSPGAQIGVANASASLNNYLGADANGWSIYQGNGNKKNNGVSTAYGAAYADGDVVGIAFDNGKMWYSKNGVWQGGGDPVAGTGEAFSGITGPVFPAAGLYRQFTPTQLIGLRCQSNNLTYPPPSGFPCWGEA